MSRRDLPRLGAVATVTFGTGLCAAMTPIATPPTPYQQHLVQLVADEVAAEPGTGWGSNRMATPAPARRTTSPPRHLA